MEIVCIGHYYRCIDTATRYITAVHVCQVVHVLCAVARSKNMKEVYMKDLYAEINNATVIISIDGDDLIIRVPYLAGDAKEIIDMLKSVGDD
jgi:hypothetical protein